MTPTWVTLDSDDYYPNDAFYPYYIAGYSLYTGPLQNNPFKLSVTHNFPSGALGSAATLTKPVQFKIVVKNTDNRKY